MLYMDSGTVVPFFGGLMVLIGDHKNSYDFSNFALYIINNYIINI